MEEELATSCTTRRKSSLRSICGVASCCEKQRTSKVYSQLSIAVLEQGELLSASSRHTSTSRLFYVGLSLLEAASGNNLKCSGVSCNDKMQKLEPELFGRHRAAKPHKSVAPKSSPQSQYPTLPATSVEHQSPYPMPQAALSNRSCQPNISPHHSDTY